MAQSNGDTLKELKIVLLEHGVAGISCREESDCDPLEALAEYIDKNRKQHELDARIDELEQTVFMPMSGKTWLDIRPDIELMRQNERYKALKAEREGL